MFTPGLIRAATLATVRNALFILPPLICAIALVVAGSQAGVIPLTQPLPVQLAILVCAVVFLCVSIVMWWRLLAWPSQIERILKLHDFVVSSHGRRLTGSRNGLNVCVTLDRPFADYRGHPSWKVRRNDDDQWIRSKVGSFDPRYMYELGALTICVSGTEWNELVAAYEVLNAQTGGKFRLERYCEDHRDSAITAKVGTWMGRYLILLISKSIQVMDSIHNKN